MKPANYIFGFIICLLTIIACKQTFEPDGKTVTTNYLVVEGIVNCGNDSTTITLSRTVLLSKKQSIKVETGAAVSVESATGIFYNLNETKPGKYQTVPLNLPLTTTYRLNIKTSNGKIYQSDFVEAKETPPIDSITYNRTVEGLNIEATAHDASNKTVYYRFAYEETWKYHAWQLSSFESTGQQIIPRLKSVYYCYRGENSTRIILGSTSKLANDVLSKQAVTFIPNRSEKISEKYSINVKQYALTKEAHEFWEGERKNTEQLGGIFDPQPSELKSNIRCITTPNEPVIGFVSVSTVTVKRIFIDPKQVNWEQPFNAHCVNADTVRGADISKLLYFSKGSKPLKIPLFEIVDPYTLLVLGYMATDEECADCRVAGGTTTPPPFWQ